jgi:hypothetical protein
MWFVIEALSTAVLVHFTDSAMYTVHRHQEDLLIAPLTPNYFLFLEALDLQESLLDAFA